MTNQIQTQAEAYARATTHTRCMRMGECEDCGIRYCDYRSRIEAYKAGYETARQQSPANPRHSALTPNIQP